MFRWPTWAGHMHQCLKEVIWPRCTGFGQQTRFLLPFYAAVCCGRAGLVAKLPSLSIRRISSFVPDEQVSDVNLQLAYPASNLFISAFSCLVNWSLTATSSHLLPLCCVVVKFCHM